MSAPTPLRDEQVFELCRLGAGRNCCAFLVFGTEWACAKATELEPVIRARVAAGTMAARGDNCTGPPDFARPAAAVDSPAARP